MAPTRMRVTVIVPNRNHSALLPRSLGAIARQTRQADEIIVVDDASTDSSREVIRGFMPILPQLRLLENTERLGVVGSLNRGLNEATGDTVYCGAADDATDPHFIEAVLGALERNPTAGLACAEARLLTEDGTFHGLRPANMPAAQEGYLTPEETAALLRRLDNWIISVVTILRRDKLIEAGGFDESLASFCDSFVERRIALETGFVFVPRVLGTWYIQPESYSRGIATNVETMAALIAVARDRVKAAEGAPFPHGYSEIFGRRARFSSARLAATAQDFDPRLINGLAQGNDLDARVLALAGRLPIRLARVAALGWLTVRLRPTSLTGLVLSAARRKLRGSADRVPG